MKTNVMTFEMLDPVYSRCQGKLLDSENGICPARMKCARFIAYQAEYLNPHHNNGDIVEPTTVLAKSYLRKGEENCNKFLHD